MQNLHVSKKIYNRNGCIWYWFLEYNLQIFVKIISEYFEGQEILQILLDRIQKYPKGGKTICYFVCIHIQHDLNKYIYIYITIFVYSQKVINPDIRKICNYMVLIPNIYQDMLPLLKYTSIFASDEAVLKRITWLFVFISCSCWINIDITV